MEPAGAPWFDPRRGYGYGVGSTAQGPMRQQQQPRSDVVAAAGAAVNGGGVLKRSLGEMERWEQQRQAQHALYMRAVRHRAAAALPPLDIAAVLSAARSPASGFSASSGFGGISPQPSSTLSSLTTASRLVMPATQQQQQPPQAQMQRQVIAVPSSQAKAAAKGPDARPATASELVLLQELEKQLLGDDEEAEPAGSACGSAVTNSEWEETIQHLNSITAVAPPLPSAVNNCAAPISRSPTSSSSSTASSSASCSPPSSSTSSRQILSEAAAAVADGNLTTASSHLAVLKIAANPRGDAEQRLVAMMMRALSSRVGLTASPPSQHLAELCGGEQRAACQLLHGVSPCFGLALHGANLAILDAVGDHRAIHLVDFDVSAAQHVALIRAIGDRRVPAASLRLTAVMDPASPFTPAMSQALAATGEQLKKVAQQAGVHLRFRAVSLRPAEIEASRLGCEPGEALAVNLAFALSRVPDESVSPANPRDELLRRVRALRPRAVALVEQELNTNTAPLAARFADACAHYGALLESLDATLGRDRAERARAEAALANKVANAVGREGPDRVERCEVFGKWRARFGMAGFRPVPLGQPTADLVRARLGPARPGFDVTSDGGRLGVGWNGRVVTVASAWQ